MGYRDIVAHFGGDDQIHRALGVGGKKRWLLIEDRVNRQKNKNGISCDKRNVQCRVEMFARSIPLPSSSNPGIAYFFVFATLFFPQPKVHLIPILPLVFLVSCRPNVPESPFFFLAFTLVASTCWRPPDARGGSSDPKGGSSYIASFGQMTIAIPFWNLPH